jgi:hypothetical protein
VVLRRSVFTSEAGGNLFTDEVCEEFEVIRRQKCQLQSERKFGRYPGRKHGTSQVLCSCALAPTLAISFRRFLLTFSAFGFEEFRVCPVSRLASEATRFEAVL